VVENHRHLLTPHPIAASSSFGLSPPPGS
jgi:hypothetical protein